MKEFASPLSDNERLNLLITDYYTQAGKGCLYASWEMVTGRAQRRINQISEILGIEEQDVMKLFMAVNLILLAPTKEEALAKAHEGFIKGTHGGQSTGNFKGDIQIAQIDNFARIAIEKCWELKQRTP